MTAGTVPWRWTLTLTCKLTDHWSVFTCIMIPYQTGKPQKHERSWVVNTSFSIYLTLSAYSNFVPHSVCTALFCPWMMSCCRTHFVLEQSCQILHNIKDPATCSARRRCRICHQVDLGRCQCALNRCVGWLAPPALSPAPRVAPSSVLAFFRMTGNKLLKSVYRGFKPGVFSI